MMTPRIPLEIPGENTVSREVAGILHGPRRPGPGLNGRPGVYFPAGGDKPVTIVPGSSGLAVNADTL